MEYATSGSSEIFREQQQAAREPGQYYLQQEQATDNDDVFDLNDSNYLFNLE